LLTDGEFPALCATWHAPDGQSLGRLDIDVVLDEDRRIEESYAGEGPGEQAQRDALERFERGALHVLLAACWYVTDERKLGIHAWDLGMRTWDVFAGDWVCRGSGVTPPEDALGALREALGREMLTPALHALRLFHARHADGTCATEVLLDNAPWTAGTSALASLSWPDHGPYTAQALVLLDVRDY